MAKFLWRNKLLIAMLSAAMLSQYYTTNNYITTALVMLCWLTLAKYTVSTNPSLELKYKRLSLVLFLCSVLLILGSFVYVFVTDGQFSHVHGEGMQPTIGPEDGIAVRKAESLDRGDIVVYKLDDSYRTLYAQAGRAFTGLEIGRIVGLPTETIEIKDGSVFVDANSIELAEDYVDNGNKSHENIEKKSLPVKKYFILKDNRKAGFDSRQLGPFTKDQISWQVVSIYKPSALRVHAWFEAATGLVMLISFFYIPYYLYSGIPEASLPLWVDRRELSITLTTYTSLVFTYILIRILKSYDEITAVNLLVIPQLSMYLIEFYHNFVAWLQFLFIASPLATLLTVGFAWLGGIMSAIQLVEKVTSHKQARPQTP